MSEALRPLVEAARAGDREAMNRLAACADRFVRIFSGSLSNTVRRAQGSTVDFVLEGLAEAMARLEGFEYRSDEEFYAWVARHIRSRIIGAARREGRLKRAARPGELHESAVEGPGPTGSRIVSDEEIRTAVGHAVIEAQVEHPEEMEAVLLKVFEGLSWPEIKEAMDLTSEKRARTLFARGVDLLRPLVERSLGAGLDDLLSS
jgi:DNA-directed RNA polymerase specialized sigma24 family protein